MRRESGLEILRSLSSSAHRVRVILLTASVENGDVVEALRLGACGVVLKNTAPQLLYKGIRAVMSGEYWVDHKSISDLLRALQVAPVPARSLGSSNFFGLTPRERDMLQALINQTYGKFTNVVATGRDWAQAKNKNKGRALKEDWADYADGRILSGTEAFKVGFVDELGTFEDAVKRAKSIAGMRNANLIEYQQRYDISDLFRLFGQTEGRVIKVDLGVEAPKLRAGQLYFLSPTFLH